MYIEIIDLPEDFCDGKTSEELIAYLRNNGTSLKKSSANMIILELLQRLVDKNKSET